MRYLIAFLAAMTLSSACAESPRAYDMYLLDGPEAGQVYAVSGLGHVAAVRIVDCTASLVDDPAPLLAQAELLRADEDANVVTVEARGSRVEFGPCAARDEHDDDSLVLIRGATARQTRALLRGIDGLPEAMRQDLIAQLGL